MHRKLKKVGIIGCGAVSKKYIAALSRIEEVEIAAVADIDAQRARDIAGDSDIAIFKSAEALAYEGGCDVLIVLTPSGDHVNQVVSLAPFGKPLIVEKPLSVATVDGQKMVQVAHRNNCPLFVVKQNRCNPPIVWLKRMIEEGRLGRPVSASVRVWWSRDQAYYNARTWRGTMAMDGGVLANQASHHIDTMLWLMGDVEAVSAMGAQRISDIETEDTANVVLRFESGALGSIEATTATRPRDIEGSISILGDRGAVTVGGFFMNQLVHWQFQDEWPEDADIMVKYSSTPSDFAWGHEMYLREVLDCIFMKKVGGVSALEALKTVQLVEAARTSMQTGEVCRIDPSALFK